MIHHGGAGTLHQTLAAGRPSLLLPRHLEQACNGAVLSARGLAAVVHGPDGVERGLERLCEASTRRTVATYAEVVAGETDLQAPDRVVASGLRLASL